MKNSITFLIMLFLIILLLLPSVASENYHLTSSVLGNGGFVHTGSEYTILGTAGQELNGFAKSLSYINEVGFWYINEEHQIHVIIEENVLPSEFRLLGNFPNPFNPSTEINYEVPEQCRVILRIYSISGQLITTLLDENVSAGFNTVKWNPESLAAGVYFYSLEAGGKRLISKMLLLK